MDEIKRPEPKTKIPSNAKQVFSGILFDVYQWEQEMFDGSTQTYEALRRADTAGVIAVTKDKKILLTRQIQTARMPFVCAAGGRLDKGESPTEAAKRELLEETGYSAEKIVELGAVQPSSKIDFAVYLFAALDAQKIAEPTLDPGEKIEALEVDFEEFLKIATKDNFRGRVTSTVAFKALTNPEYKEELKKKLGLN
jgi:ADP-ribose pyrophosphatase